MRRIIATTAAALVLLAPTAAHAGHHHRADPVTCSTILVVIHGDGTADLSLPDGTNITEDLSSALADISGWYDVYAPAQCATVSTVFGP